MMNHNRLYRGVENTYGNIVRALVFGISRNVLKGLKIGDSWQQLSLLFSVGCRSVVFNLSDTADPLPKIISYILIK
jgi:hypothetical protein